MSVDISDARFPPEVEASAYFVIAEALTNVMKHSQATSAEVVAAVNAGSLCIEVRDNGTGGADPDGQGLVGMKDRVTALGGRLEVESPAGRGTLLSATLRFQPSSPTPMPAAARRVAPPDGTLDPGQFTTSLGVSWNSSAGSRLTISTTGRVRLRSGLPKSRGYACT